jgi:hypothetical protein
MYRNIDVMAEMRKFAGSKPVQAVAGAGALASQTLKDLPALLSRWGTGNPVTALPSRATGYAHTAQARATGYAQTAQARASGYAHTAQARATGYAQTAQARASGYAHTAQARATGYAQTAQAHASEYVQTARARAAGGYDTLAARGRKALNGQPHTAEGTSTPPKGTQAAQRKTAVNGKAKGKAPSRPSASH